LRENTLDYATQNHINYFDCADYIQASENDGIHLDEENNTLLAQYLTQKIQSALHH